MSASYITSWELSGEIGILTLSNGKGNYLIEPEFVNLDQLKEWTSDDNLKGIIIQGAGRNYSAGASLEDLSELSQNLPLLGSKLNNGKKILDYLENLDIPVVSAIKGACFGGGLEIALASHIRIGSANSLYAFPEVNYALIPGMGGTKRLPDLIGNKAFSMILEGDVINAAKANEIGLIDIISESKDVYDFSFHYLERLVAGKPLKVIRSVMQSLRNAKKLSMKDALIEETRLFIDLAKDLI